MKIWTCYDDLVAQQWNKLPDGQLTVVGSGKCFVDLVIFPQANLVFSGQCLDLTGGNLTNSNQVQTWQCADGNRNQIWTQ